VVADRHEGVAPAASHGEIVRSQHVAPATVRALEEKALRTALEGDLELPDLRAARAHRPERATLHDGGPFRLGQGDLEEARDAAHLARKVPLEIVVVHEEQARVSPSLPERPEVLEVEALL